MSDLKTYIFKKKRGIDDLEGLNERTADYWTPEDWAKWNADTANRVRRNERYIDRLKGEGRYGEEYEETLTVQPNKLFDDRQMGKCGVESYRMVMLDFSEKCNKKIKIHNPYTGAKMIHIDTPRPVIKKESWWSRLFKRK